MIPLEEAQHDKLARNLERPLLKLNPNFSPFFGAWFSIESPNPSYFDADGKLIINHSTLGYTIPNQPIQSATSGAEERLYGSLKRMLKQKSKPDKNDSGSGDGDID